MSRADWRQVHALLLIALIALAVFIPSLRVWPWCWLVPLGVYTALVAAVPPLRRTAVLPRIGHFSGRAVLVTTLIAIASTAVLFAYPAPPAQEIGGYRDYLPVTPLGDVLVAGLLFSVFNAFFEEFIFRGVLFDALESSPTGPHGAVLATAFLFGYGHLRGYPPGIPGALLAGVYGLALGWLRVFTGGLGLCFLAHIVADATIFSILAHHGVFNPETFREN